MRLHTDKITHLHLADAIVSMTGVNATAGLHGSRSRSRDHAFEVKLTGTGTHKSRGGYGPNTEDQAATWDEWGVFIARLYQIDPDALWGTAKHPVYRDADDFHYQTCDRFKDGTMPADTHKRHTWLYSGTTRLFYCPRCSAEKSVR